MSRLIYNDYINIVSYAAGFGNPRGQLDGSRFDHQLLPRLGGAFDLRLAVSVPLPIVMGIFVLLWFQSRLT